MSPFIFDWGHHTRASLHEALLKLTFTLNFIENSHIILLLCYNNAGDNDDEYI